MNSIPKTQNDEIQLRRLGAQRRLYARAKFVFASHVTFAGPVAACLALVGLTFPPTKPFIAAWGLALALADLLWLSRWQKVLRENAAKIQEAFDCDVLELPWQELKVGKAVDPELVVAYSRQYDEVAKSYGPLRDWYPIAVERLPLASGRILCQRTNCWWDGRQRGLYSRLMWLVLGALVTAGIALGLGAKLPMTDFFLTIVAPFSPLLVLCVRQILENGDASTRLDSLKAHADSLWKSALAGASADSLSQRSRNLQDEIFDARKRNPPVLDILYSRIRASQELDMKQAVEDSVRDMHSAAAGPPNSEG